MFQILPADSCSSPVDLTVCVDAAGGGRALGWHHGHGDQAQGQAQHHPHWPHPWLGQRSGVIKWFCNITQGYFSKKASQEEYIYQMREKEIQRPEMWTGQPLSCYWTWRMAQTKSAKWAATTTDCEKPTQDAGPGRHGQWPGWRGSDFKQ